MSVNDLLDLYPGGLADVRVMPEDTRDRGGGDSGLPGNIVNGHFFAHHSHLFLIFVSMIP